MRQMSAQNNGVLFSEAIRQSEGRPLAEVIGDDLTLLQVRKGTKFHTGEGCSTLRRWQPAPEPTVTAFSKLNATKICASCDLGPRVKGLLKGWETLPSVDLSSPIVVGGLVDVAYESQVVEDPVAVILRRLFEWAGALANEYADNWGRLYTRYVGVLPVETYSWLYTFVAQLYRAKVQNLGSPLTDDTGVTFEIAASLWDPLDMEVEEGESPFNELSDALAAARAIGKVPSPR